MKFLSQVFAFLTVVSVVAVIYFADSPDILFVNYDPATKEYTKVDSFTYLGYAVSSTVFFMFVGVVTAAYATQSWEGRSWR